MHYVATEFGVVNLFGKSLQERALAMISIANPASREILLHAAQESGLIGVERGKRGFIRGIYPQNLEETLVIDGSTVVIRPVKPVDVRRIQEHYYNLDKTDVYSRFLHKRKNFFHKEMEGIAQIDYLRQLTILAVVGDFGFGKVVGMGEYYLGTDNALAEVSFSVSKNFQKKGIGRRLLTKLSQAARDNGIEGLTAYISFNNRKMIKLFNTLPYQVSTSKEGEILALTCRFDKSK